MFTIRIASAVSGVRRWGWLQLCAVLLTLVVISLAVRRVRADWRTSAADLRRSAAELIQQSASRAERGCISGRDAVIGADTLPTLSPSAYESFRRCVAQAKGLDHELAEIRTARADDLLARDRNATYVDFFLALVGFGLVFVWGGGLLRRRENDAGSSDIGR